MTTRNKVERDETVVLLLGSLVESAGLVQAATGCVLRWGLSATSPQGESHRDELLRELDDMKGAIARLEKVLLPSSMLPGSAVGAKDAGAANGS